MLVQIGSSFQLSTRQNFIGDCLPVIGKAARDVVASNGQQQLPFFHSVAKSRVDTYDAPRRE